MTMPNSRKITIDNKAYNYQLKGKTGRIIGNTHPCIKLTVELSKNNYLQAHFWSKEYDEYLHDDMGFEHKIAFTPKDVSIVIKEYLKHKCLSKDFELESWELGWTNIQGTG